MTIYRVVPDNESAPPCPQDHFEVDAPSPSAAARAWAEEEDPYDDITGIAVVHVGSGSTFRFTVRRVETYCVLPKES
jgi:hypothetical protein